MQIAFSEKGYRKKNTHHCSEDFKYIVVFTVLEKYLMKTK